MSSNSDAITRAQRHLETVRHYAEMQRRLDAMDGDSNIVNALSALIDACNELANYLEQAARDQQAYQDYLDDINPDWK